MKAVVLDGYTLNPGDLSWDLFKNLCDFEIYDKTLPEQVLERTADAEIVLTNKVVFSKDVIESLPKLKYIGVLSTGCNVVDLETAYKRNICVTNIPSYSTDSVAQLVFALIFGFYWHVKEHSDEVFSGKWTSSPYFCYHSFPIYELSHKTIGIIGFGAIGQAVAKIALAMNMRVLYFNRSLKKCAGLEKAVQVDLDELLAHSDIISLNCPLTEETKHIINENSLHKIKPSAYIINTGRGALIDEFAVLRFLKEKRLAGLAVDVLSTEPPESSNPLLAAPRCIITPHIAWQTFEARSRLMQIAASNVRAFINGNPENVVTIT